ncbi:MAG: hypothetical protein AAF694_10550 [Bacteroidota bacterium]
MKNLTIDKLPQLEGGDYLLSKNSTCPLDWLAYTITSMIAFTPPGTSLCEFEETYYGGLF